VQEPYTGGTQESFLRYEHCVVSFLHAEESVAQGRAHILFSVPSFAHGIQEARDKEGKNRETVCTEEGGEEAFC